ncbi:MAG: DnaD domain protein [Blautia sp.]|nr:DnaD domain protein [Blautia sp.]
MSLITIRRNAASTDTAVSNLFIDTYMPRANGEFVKVYLYLLRLSGMPDALLSLEKMADELLCTEKDILRAVRYWAGEGLLKAEYQGNKELSSVTFCEPAETGLSIASKETADSAGVPSGAAPARLTPERVRELRQNKDITLLLYTAEQYLGKTLTSTESQKILSYYDELHMSPELIEYLIEYCVSHNHKSMHYIEKVALSWHENGITTVKAAKEASSLYNKDYYTILRSMGIRSRDPVEEEISLMDTWLKEYGFSMAIIQEACSRTILQTGQPSFPYADGILRDWKKQNVRTPEDIRVLDEEHQKKQKQRQTAASPSRNPSPGNRFNNFKQRKYDFDKFEQRMLAGEQASAAPKTTDQTEE